MAGTQAGLAGRGDEPSALAVLLDGLIDRAQRSPLMRRAPAQCSPEEQVALANVLADLVALRAVRTALDGMPALRLEQVNVHWPELGALLGAARRSGGSRAKPREGQSSGSGGLFDTVPAEGDTPAPPGEDVVRPESGADVEPPQPAANPASGDLARLLLEALTVQGRALNTTQMLTWLNERGAKATREDVMNTLFGHEELFRRRGPGHWVVAGQDSTSAP